MMPIGKHPDVRRTVLLDEDLVTLLTEEARRSGMSFQEAVNHFLRLGLMAQHQQRKPFLVNPRPLGLPPGLSYDNLEDLLERLEGPTHK
jgi:hypothetical protein